MFMRLFVSSSHFLFFSFLTSYLVAILYFHYASWRDPTSLFFKPHEAYKQIYSAVRQDEAEAFVLEATTASKSAKEKQSNELSRKSLCVGIPTVVREGTDYVRTAVGSLLEGLTAQERNDIYLIVFIPHTDPTTHPVYSESWLYNITDEVLVYNLPQDQLEHIAILEKEAGVFREKGLIDYTYLLKACFAQDTPYIAIFEDDIVAMDGWYHRTIAALEQAEILSALSKGSVGFLYLRLFYTEELLGWNSENWPSYVMWSSLIAIIAATVLVSFRSCFTTTGTLLNNRVILGICCTCIPMLIGLYFAAGKVTVSPLPAGVNEMNNYGCCSQGLIFPRHKVLALIDWFETKKVGFVDVLTEEYADQHGELRWALTPSVVQHVGRKSSKDDEVQPGSRYQMTVAERIWNFAFELNDAASLRREHLSVTKSDRTS